MGRNVTNQNSSHSALTPASDKIARNKIIFPKQRNSNRLNPLSAYTLAQIPNKINSEQQIQVVIFIPAVCANVAAVYTLSDIFKHKFIERDFFHKIGGAKYHVAELRIIEQMRL